MTGLPKNIIKKYGVTKKAWAVFRGLKSSRSKARGPKTKRVKRIGKVRNLTRRRRFSRAKRRSSGLSIRGFMRRTVLPAAPHLLSNTGVAGLGYNVFASGMSLGDRLKFLGTNELLLFTGYDAYARRWNWLAPGVNYGAMFIPTVIGKVVKMLTGRR